MASSPYRYTSGRMLHYEGCEHFFEETPPREATDEELRSLPVCGTCAGQTRSASGGSLGDAGRFTCPECHLSKVISLRTESGICRDCV